MEPCDVLGDGLLLRPHAPADVAQLEVIALDPEIARWNPITEPSVAEWSANRLDWGKGDHASWIIASASDRSTVRGAISLHHIDLAQLNGELGYWVAPDHRGAGLGGQAARTVARWGFDVLGLRRIQLFHSLGNEASCRVATAAGFRYEGTHRQSFRRGDGPFQDEHCHAKISDDPD